jgi:acyl-coenzyme A synthetase/AMP-(fatty) acid ligase
MPGLVAAGQGSGCHNRNHGNAPRAVTFAGELPKTATGKIQKFVLRKGAPNLARQQPGSAGSPAG